MQPLIVRKLCCTFAFVLLWMALSGSLWPVSIHAQTSPPTPEPSAQLLNQTEMPVPPFVAGRVLVGVLEAEVGAASADVPWTDLGVLEVAPLDVRSAPVAAAGAAVLTGFQLTVPAGEEWSIIEVLQSHPAVLFAEPDWVARTAQNEAQATTVTDDAAIPVIAATETPFRVNDSLYADQWYLQRVGMSRAWEAALGEGGAGLNEVVVAVLDTGVDFTHPDLQNRLLPGRNYLVPGGTPQDNNGHGTHIAGLIAAAANNGGMVGAGWDARILPMKVLDAAGFGSISTIAQAVRDAADGNAAIINLSLEILSDSFVLRTAVEYAGAQGALVIAAAGNCRSTIISNCPVPVRYPAAYPTVLAVAATTYYDGVPYYSAQGSELDIAAPGGGSGQSILSTWSSSSVSRCTRGLREVNNGFYCLADGTSMAAGVASGVAALIWSVRPELSADQVRAILLASAAPLAGSSSVRVGEGRLDAERALRLALRPRLYFDTSQVAVTVPEGTATVTRDITLFNPSLEPLTWAITPTGATDWYAVVGPRTGTVRYGESISTQLVLTPTQMGPGQHLGEYRVSTSSQAGGSTIYSIGVKLEIVPQLTGSSLYLPIALGRQPVFAWAQPDVTGRTAYTIFDQSSLTLSLPFTLTVAGRSYTDMRVYDDGFLVFSGSAAPQALPTHCIANQVWPSLTIYGWWSDLQPAPTFSRLSTFTSEPGSFVVEYENFQLAGAVNPTDWVTFQIVLQASGRVEFNYRTVPQRAPTNVTVGVAAADGRFYNQVTCRRANTQLGILPQPRQTLTFLPEDLY